LAVIDQKLKNMPITYKWITENQRNNDFFYLPTYLNMLKNLLKKDSILYVTTNLEQKKVAQNQKNSTRKISSISLIIIGLIGVSGSVWLAIYRKGTYSYAYAGIGILSGFFVVLGTVLLVWK
jgi:hypothetical protein